ncbi:MAG: MFS transporter, partial [Methanobacterium sp.]|nr:MFS transporter [Methanobacterium sp.]
SMNVNTPYYLLLAYSTVLGVGSGMAYTIFNVAVQNAFPLREIGIVTASIRFFRNVGTIVFVSIFGYIMNLTLASSASATVSYTPALALSIQNIFLVAIVVAFVGLVVAFFLEEIPLGDDYESAEDAS